MEGSIIPILQVRKQRLREINDLFKVIQLIIRQASAKMSPPERGSPDYSSPKVGRFHVIQYHLTLFYLSFFIALLLFEIYTLIYVFYCLSLLTRM